MTNEQKWLLEEKYSGVATPEYEADVIKLASGEPLAYIIGHVPFLNTTIYLDSHPLIPRPETEYWVERIIKDMPEAPRVLDLCAGSGCIGIAVQHARPNARVDFAEIDEKHHDTIRKNGGEHMYGGDLFEQITEKYDYILTNPPYIDPEIDRAEKSVKEHEPHQALYGGAGGMELITHIITEAPQYLKENGILVIEHEPEQSEEINELAKKNGFLCETREDQYGVERWSLLQST